LVATSLFGPIIEKVSIFLIVILSQFFFSFFLSVAIG
jgi:hypothetical protein